MKSLISPNNFFLNIYNFLKIVFSVLFKIFVQTFFVDNLLIIFLFIYHFFKIVFPILFNIFL